MTMDLTKDELDALKSAVSYFFAMIALSPPRNFQPNWPPWVKTADVALTKLEVAKP